MSGTSNGHPIGVHIGYCPCIHNTWINCSTTSMEKCSFTLHSKSNGNFTTCTYRLLWKKKSVVVYERGWHYWDSTLLAPRLSQGSDNVGHPNETLVGEKAYLWWVTECTYGARTRIYGGSHKFNTIGEVCCQQLVLFWHTLDFELILQSILVQSSDW